MSIAEFTSVVDVLKYHSKQTPTKTAYLFLGDSEADEVRLTYQDLDLKARAIAAALQARCRAGDRALLLYSSGIEFIPAFFGCLYARVMAVPVYPPNPGNLDVSMGKFLSIFSDAEPSVVMTTEDILGLLDFLKNDYPELEKINWLASDKVHEDISKDLKFPKVDKDTIAFLQYTSGSTGTPKGVMVSHGNILYNQKMIKESFGHSEKTVFTGWLPLFHDMGLIGNVLQPLYLGVLSVLMSPVDFIKKPFRWLDAISRYKATTSGGPNFGYDLCCRKITDAQIETLDLSSWNVAFNGAEPVRAETMEAFAKKFNPCGFREKSFYPCYGMAEATLFISGGIPSQSAAILDIETASIEQDRADVKSEPGDTTRKIVGCGRTWMGQKICIVNPKTETLCPDDGIGEIWVSGENITQGYWRKPEATRETFHACIKEPDTDEGPFLRTGDLGFMTDNELFVTGRVKDLIIIRGRNLYPHDIEMAAFNSHPSLRPGCGAAFSTTIDHEEKLIVVQEIKERDREHLDLNDVIAEMNVAISRYFDVSAHAIVLIRQGALPKTSSGKVQRRQCRSMFLENKLDTVAFKIFESTDPEPDLDVRASMFESVENIEDWLVLKVARYASVDSDIIEFSSSLFDYGLDSKQIISLNGEVEEIFGSEISPTVFIDNPTISGIAGHLADEFIHRKKKG